MDVSSQTSISPHRLDNDGARVTLTHTFSGNPLDRGDLQRRDEAWLEGAARDQSARFVPMWQLNVLLRGTQAPELGWLSPGAIDQLRLETPPVVLGLRAGVPH